MKIPIILIVSASLSAAILPADPDLKACGDAYYHAKEVRHASLIERKKLTLSSMPVTMKLSFARS